MQLYFDLQPSFILYSLILINLGLNILALAANTLVKCIYVYLHITARQFNY